LPAAICPSRWAAENLGYLREHWLSGYSGRAHQGHPAFLRRAALKTDGNCADPRGYGRRLVRLLLIR
jgi:hypothetical protein